jgi:hypothetical protein
MLAPKADTAPWPIAEYRNEKDAAYDRWRDGVRDSADAMDRSIAAEQERIRQSIESTQRRMDEMEDRRRDAERNRPRTCRTFNDAYGSTTYCD